MTEAMAALQNKKLISGVVRINQRCYKEAYINSPVSFQYSLLQQRMKIKASKNNNEAATFSE